ncbi:MAG: DUF1499 domain-containing protein [Parvibaculum sp.]|uniref:DUF1499 domain-containing protein n=1 Tax=Parvibaculum sp. TaxID=2024848 RepID=UPI0032EB0296
MNFQNLRLTAKPNQYLVAPEGLCAGAKPHLAAPEFAVAPAALRARFRDVALAQPRVILAGADDAALTDIYVQRSALLGFPDTVTVQFLAAGTGRSSLAIYSRSRYGYSDLGVNKARIDTWLRKLAAKCPA